MKHSVLIRFLFILAALIVAISSCKERPSANTTRPSVAEENASTKPISHQDKTPPTLERSQSSQCPGDGTEPVVVTVNQLAAQALVTDIYMVNDNLPSLTLVNQSISNALVRLKGPKSIDVRVGACDRTTINLDAGQYNMRIRFGANEHEYTYSKGDSFSVKATSTTVSKTRIIFNSSSGNYSTQAISSSEFWR